MIGWDGGRTHGLLCRTAPGLGCFQGTKNPPPGGGGETDGRKSYWMSFSLAVISSSTRRLAARPAAVELEATGLDEP